MKKYFFNLVEKKITKKSVVSKRKTIVVWNNFYAAKIHQGRYHNQLLQSELHLSFKFGEFTKTRKPFFFRSKKKR
jgi:ribosomal protein S19